MRPPNPTTWLRSADWGWRQGLVGLALLGALLYFATTCYLGATSVTNGFPGYYTSSQLIREGVSPARFYDNSWYGAQVQRFVPTLREIYSPNPPTTAFFLLPLSFLDLGTARAVWIAINVLMLMGCIRSLVSGLRLSPILTVVLVASVLVCFPVRENIRHGQTHILATFLWAEILSSYCRGRDVRLGCAFAVLALAKTGGLLMWIVLLIQTRWRALLTIVTFVALGVLVTWSWIGLDGWMEYVRVVPPQASQAWIAVTAYQSIQGMLFHLGVFDPKWNPHPLFNAKAVVEFGSFLIDAGVVIVVLVLAKRTRQFDLLVGAVITSSLVLVPVAADYHYSVMVVPLAILASHFGQMTAGWHRRALVVAVVVMGFDFHHNSPRLMDGWRSFLAYSMLYGALLVLGLTMALLRQSKTAHDQS